MRRWPQQWPGLVRLVEDARVLDRPPAVVIPAAASAPEPARDGRISPARRRSVLALVVALGACGANASETTHGSSHRPLAPDTADARAILEAADRRLAGYRSVSLETAV